MKEFKFFTMNGENEKSFSLHLADAWAHFWGAISTSLFIEGIEEELCQFLDQVEHTADYLKTEITVNFEDDTQAKIWFYLEDQDYCRRNFSFVTGGTYTTINMGVEDILRMSQYIRDNRRET